MRSYIRLHYYNCLPFLQPARRQIYAKFYAKFSQYITFTATYCDSVLVLEQSCERDIKSTHSLTHSLLYRHWQQAGVANSLMVVTAAG